ncbi:unnamed protein product [Rotaria socialis]|uniref:Uncharacterized protein n=2 Tax=Rotaria socialis TaxID=392032 RepID=A0A818N953_9BILA|nr:unnamed protein product [Rotaria socialis]CAF4838224.1 unnamed protein product [Rotaria socialis]
MRTSPFIIERVSYWLNSFSLAELVFVLNEDARIPPFDKFRISKIATAVRHKFMSDQPDECVKMLIDDLSTAYCQTRPMHKQNSLSSIMVHQNDHLLVPFRTSCPTCNRSLDASDAIQKRVRLYRQNGSVVIGIMYTLNCQHKDSTSITNNDNSPISIYPNFTRGNKCNVYTHNSLHHGDYIYLGGDIAIERSIIDRYTAQIVHNGLSMIGLASTVNQEAFNLGNHQLAPIERRLLSNILHAYLIIQFDLSMGNASVSTPDSLEHFSQWGWEQFPRLLTYFVYLWTNHRTLIGSCGEHCSKCLVVDGHQKSRRRICAFKDVKVDTQEMTDLVIGCCRTPIRSSRFCQLHNNETAISRTVQSKHVLKKQKLNRKFIRRLPKRLHETTGHLHVTGCRTLKETSDEYVKKCTRSLGIIALVSNCRIITSFSELYRSETLREIINLFATTIRVAGQLAPTCVYDDGCHLVKYIKNHIGKELAQTPAMLLLNSTPISVDRSHFRNHVGTFCRQTMNPDKNPLLDGVNTQAAEQTFSWLKQYAQIISNLNYLRAPLFMLVLFHLKNLSMVQKAPSFVSNVASSIPNVHGVSLCHLADNKSNFVSNSPEKLPMFKDEKSADLLHEHRINLPKGTTDWDAIMLDIMSKHN